MELVLFVLGGGGVAAAGRYAWARRMAKRRQAAELADVRRLADEDVTQYGEQLARLGDVLAGRELDAAARADYQTSLDLYEQAKRAVPRLDDLDAVSGVTAALADGRYAIACVQARVTGRPIPERRVSCYFNAQHGPSTTDVVWTPANGGTRKVAACAQDAARIAAGDEPDKHYPKDRDFQFAFWEPYDPDQPFRFGFWDIAGARAVKIHLRLEPIAMTGRGRRDPTIVRRDRNC
ncbi:hypothetical protein [Kribbella italica]|uniref:Uncharacterized protein n=1 Tax=Kribbella italica TaxID=1540520 RepID=A0A7W9J8T6_9ACTN|nr:hypothetical protein [Kribbella italica]MBB5837252.1 hypothetical protein [Kribbella italica]